MEGMDGAAQGLVPATKNGAAALVGAMLPLDFEMMMAMPKNEQRC